MEVFRLKTWCSHMALLSSDNIVFPEPDTPCNRCRHSSGNWFCLYCKNILCGATGNRHMGEHYEQTDHCLAIFCSSSFVAEIPIVRCFSCKAATSACQVIRRLHEFSSPCNDVSSLKLEKLDGMMVDVAYLISKPLPGFNNNSVDAMPFDSQHEYALAKQGLLKIFDQGLEALADDQLQREFLTYSATLLSSDSCSSELKAELSSFRGDIPEEAPIFIEARNELKVASDLKASITLKKYVLQQEYYKYTNAKKELLASEERIANLEAALATEESNKVKTAELLDLIVTQVISAKDNLVSELAQVSDDMEETVEAAKQLVSQRQSVWNSLRTTFMKFA